MNPQAPLPPRPGGEEPTYAVAPKRIHCILPGILLLAAGALAIAAHRYRLDRSFAMGAVFFATTALCGWVLAWGNSPRGPRSLRHPLVGLATMLAVGGTLLATVILALSNSK